MPHLALGFIMALFAGKAIQSENKFYFVPAMIIPWLLHGAYDFCLDPIMDEISDIFGLVALLLAISDIVIVIIMLVFIGKARKNEKYTSLCIDAEGTS